MKTPFKVPKQGPSFRLPVSLPTPLSVDTDTHDTPEVSDSIRSANKGTETSSLTPRVTRSVVSRLQEVLLGQRGPSFLRPRDPAPRDKGRRLE